MASTKKTSVSVRGLPRQVAVWRAAAAHDDIRLSEFLRRAADEYAQRRLTGSAPEHVNGG